jgi:hypothetical protein
MFQLPEITAFLLMGSLSTTPLPPSRAAAGQGGLPVYYGLPTNLTCQVVSESGDGSFNLLALSSGSLIYAMTVTAAVGAGPIDAGVGDVETFAGTYQWALVVPLSGIVPSSFTVSCDLGTSLLSSWDIFGSENSSPVNGAADTICEFSSGDPNYNGNNSVTINQGHYEISNQSLLSKSDTVTNANVAVNGVFINAQLGILVEAIIPTAPMEVTLGALVLPLDPGKDSSCYAQYLEEILDVVAVAGP